FVDAKITNSNENKANPVNYSTQGFTGDPIISSNYNHLKYCLDCSYNIAFFHKHKYRISYTVIHNANDIRDNMCSCTMHSTMAYQKPTI
ncbi:hypothetical protein, partial [Leyella stercorea]|uniref:hypothetical protein n=1 Tax=Leyella stercorea TaxID=363265 RepID=UPI001F23AD49